MAVKIIKATSADEDRVFQFLCENFYPDEPLNVALNIGTLDDKSNCASLGILKENKSFLAVKEDDPNIICGVFLNKEISKESDDDAWMRLQKKNEEKPYGEILKFLTYAGENFTEQLNKCWDETKTDKALDTTIIAVRKENRRQNLGYQLMERTIELAKELNYRWMTIECSSTYSAKLVEKLGFYPIYQLPYRDYKNEKGEVVFRTPAPHFVFRGLVKELKPEA